MWKALIDKYERPSPTTTLTLIDSLINNKFMKKDEQADSYVLRISNAIRECNRTEVVITPKVHLALLLGGLSDEYKATKAVILGKEDTTVAEAERQIRAMQQTQIKKETKESIDDSEKFVCIFSSSQVSNEKLHALQEEWACRNRVLSVTPRIETEEREIKSENKSQIEE
jgi:hypothetical protein